MQQRRVAIVYIHGACMYYAF